MNGAQEDLPVYTVRLAEQASRQVEDEWQRLANMTGAKRADAWREGLRAALAGLATLPERCPAAPENTLYPAGTLRQLLYRPRPGRTAWRILFSLTPATQDDPPTVRVHQVRHSAQAALTAWPSQDS